MPDKHRKTPVSTVERPYASRDVAARLGVTIEYASALMVRGEIPGAYRTHGRRGKWRVSRGDLERYIERLKSETTASIARAG